MESDNERVNEKELCGYKLEAIVRTKLHKHTMNRIALFLVFILLSTETFAQCISPHFRVKELNSKTLTKDSIYAQIKSDLTFIQPTKHDTIADIGSFDGYYPLAYSIFSDSVVFYLNDISNSGFVDFDSIKTICTTFKGQHISNKFKTIIGTDSCTNLPNHLFNKVVIRDALHHFKSMDKMLSDTKRIMKPQATLILFEPIKDQNVKDKKLCYAAMTKDELLKLLSRNGFKLTKEFTREDGRMWFEFKLKKNRNV